MKTPILTLFSALVLSSGIAKAQIATTVKSESVTSVSAINKIEVHGNVELYISEGPADKVKVYNMYYAENALVHGAKGVLRISSYKAEKLVVWVTAADLRSIAAYDNSEVKTFGNESAIEFNVDLYNNASAKLNFESFSANITVNDLAKVELSGSSNEINIKYSHAENVNYSNLASKQTSTTCQTASIKVKKFEANEIAGL
jgi:hypothetical protein